LLHIGKSRLDLLGAQSSKLEWIWIYIYIPRPVYRTEYEYDWLSFSWLSISC